MASGVKTGMAACCDASAATTAGLASGLPNGLPAAADTAVPCMALLNIILWTDGNAIPAPPIWFIWESNPAMFPPSPIPGKATPEGNAGNDSGVSVLVMWVWVCCGVEGTIEGRLWMGCFECPSIPVRFIRGIPGLDGLPPSSDDDRSDAMLLELPFDSVAMDIECDIGILWPITCAFVGGVELTSILGQRSDDDSIQGE